MKNKLVEWALKKWNGVQSVKPVEVTIGELKFSGVHYVQNLEFNGRPYTRTAYYLLGHLPEKIKGRASTKVCFPDAAGVDWYAAGYIKSDGITPSNVQFHPFGEHFLLMPWDVADKIDQYEKKPYTRVPFTVKQ